LRKDLLLSLEYQVVSFIRKEIGIDIAQCVNYHVNCGALRRLLGALTTGRMLASEVSLDCDVSFDNLIFL